MGFLWNPWRHKSQKKPKQESKRRLSRVPIVGFRGVPGSTKPSVWGGCQPEGYSPCQPQPVKSVFRGIQGRWQQKFFYIPSLDSKGFFTLDNLYNKPARLPMGIWGHINIEPYEEKYNLLLGVGGQFIIRVYISLWPGCPLKNWFWIASLFPFLIFCLHKFYYNLSGITA